MDKKTLLAEATRKLDRQPVAKANVATRQSADGGPSLTPGEHFPTSAPLVRKAEPVVSKGITLRPRNIEKLDSLELSLRKQGIKAGHSGLIQIAIELLEDSPQLAVAYRELLKLDLRSK